MSRNRTTTRCACHFWDLADGIDELPLDAPGMMTDVEYMDDIGMPKGHPYRDNHGHGLGFGFREDLNGRSFDSWVCETEGQKGWSNFPPQLGDPRAWTYKADVYRTVPPDMRYRWRKIQCPICQRLYVGYYRQQPTLERWEPTWTIYDTSYYYAYNDEPSERDLAELIDWTSEEIVAVLREAAKHRKASRR